MFGLPVFSQTATPEENQKIMNQMQHLQDTLFLAPVIPLPEVNYDVEVSEETTGMERYTATKNGTPLFKKMRIKIQNYYRIKAHEQELKDKKREQEELKRLQEEEEKELSKDLSIEELTERNLKKIYGETEASEEEEVKPDKEKRTFASFFKRKPKAENDTKTEQIEKQEEVLRHS